jgi:chromosome segregation ATPase
MMERENYSSYSIINLSHDQLVAYSTTRGKLDTNARRAFAKLASARAAIDEVDTKVREVERQKQSIFRDQDRVRENLRSLSGTSDIQQKYLRKLNEQEDQVTKLDAMREKLAALRVEREQALKDMIVSLEF